MKIAIQGELGSFHHIASQHFYGGEHGYVCCDSFRDVFAALGDGRADTAVVAVENSLFGSIAEVYDLLLKHGYPVVGEVVERIHQNLITFPGANLGQITRVYSHPVALAQCSEFLNREMPNAEIIEHHDTAASAAFVKHAGDHASAAIASRMAADMHDMGVLRPNIQDEHRNYTRFLAIQPGGQAPVDATKASMVITTSHRPGALYESLGVFADAGINLTKLQSRPIRGKIWKYQFYIDIETKPPDALKAIELLEDLGCGVTNLGMYKSAAKTFED